MSRREFLLMGGAGLVGATLLGGCAAGTGQGGGNGGGNTGGGGGGGGDFPNKPIDVIVSYEAGGVTDVGARILQPYVEEELGQSIRIVNRPGGGGWVGWTALAQAKPNGYTIGFINSPNLMTGYLNPEFDRKQSLESFAPIGNQVTDYGAIAINPNDDRFQTIEELIEYAKENEATATSTGVGSDDHFASLTLNDQFGTKFEAIHNSGSAESRAAVLGGNVDALFANVGEVKPLHDEGELKAIAVMRESEERSPFLEDVPTLPEAGYDGVYSWSSRGLAGPSGIDPGIMETLVAAFEAAIQNQDHIDELAQQGLQVDYRGPEEHMQMLKKDEQRARKLGDKFIW